MGLNSQIPQDDKSHVFSLRDQENHLNSFSEQPQPIIKQEPFFNGRESRDSRNIPIFDRESQNVSMRGGTNKFFEKVGRDSQESPNISSFGLEKRKIPELGRAKPNTFLGNIPKFD